MTGLGIAIDLALIGLDLDRFEREVNAATQSPLASPTGQAGTRAD